MYRYLVIYQTLVSKATKRIQTQVMKEQVGVGASCSRMPTNIGGHTQNLSARSRTP